MLTHHEYEENERYMTCGDGQLRDIISLPDIVHVLEILGKTMCTTRRNVLICIMNITI